MKNLLIVTRSTVLHNKSGGLETQLDNLIETLKEDYRVTVLTTALPFKREPQKIHQLRVYKGCQYIFLKNTIPGEYGPSLFENLFWQIPVKRNFDTLDKGFRKAAAKYYKENLAGSFELILSQSSSAQNFNITTEKLVSVNHGTTLNEINSRASSIASFKDWVRFLFLDIPVLCFEYLYNNPKYFKKCRKIIVVSKGVEDDFKKQHQGFKDKLVVINNGIDTKKFTPSSNKFAGAITKVFYVGRVDFEKGLKEFIDVAKKTSDAKNIQYSVYGDGPDSSEFKSLIMQSGLSNIKYIGPVDNSKISQVMSQSHIFLFLSNRKEGLPMSIIESLSSGCVVLTTYSGFVKKEFIVAVNTSKQASDIIKELTKNKKKMREFSAAARLYATKKYSYKRMGDDYAKVLSDL